jgi:hypothetical protein
MNKAMNSASNRLLNKLKRHDTHRTLEMRLVGKFVPRRMAASKVILRNWHWITTRPNDWPPCQ